MLKNKKIRRKHFKIALSSLLFLAIFLFAWQVLAADVNVGLEYPAQIGLGATDPRVIVAKIIRIALGFLGILAVGLILYAGFLWMTSEGNEEKVSRAKKVLTNAVIGLIIILSAFTLATFILNKLIGATGEGGNVGPDQNGGGGGIAALGSGIIESHYPGRNQNDVARNTKIIITFKEPMDVATLISNEKINIDNVKIFKTSDGSSGPKIADVTARKTPDNKTFSFKPNQYLGSSKDKIWYTVSLSRNIKKANGDLAFGNLTEEVGYEWSFEVGTYIDNTPPQVDSVIPTPGNEEPRNVVIQINFNEAVDPIAASGVFKGGNGFNNIKVKDIVAGSLIEGTFYVSNQYKTVEFLTFDECGKNSCGNTIYCLPGNKNLAVLAQAATLAALGEPSSNFPYDGIVDMADNSLDGNSNKTAEGPEAQSHLSPFNANAPDQTTPGDDYTWSFSTNNTIDITAPTITNIYPNINQESVGLDVVPEAKFSKLLMSASVNTNSVKISNNQAVALNYWTSCFNNLIDKRTTIYIRHDQFIESVNYRPELNSGVRDIYQNCFYKCSGLGINGGPSCCNGAPSANASCQ